MLPTAVRINYPLVNAEEYREFKEGVEKYIRLRSSVLVRIVQVRETKNKGFTIDYEYVEESIKNNAKIK